MTDSELQGLLAKLPDRNAFSKIYEELKQPVYTVCFRILGSREQAEDVCHDLFLKLYRNPPRDVRNGRAWIFQSARNLCIDTLRREAHRQHDALEDSPITHWPQWDQRLDLEAAMAALHTELREIVTLHLNAGLSFSRIAQIMGTSLPAVYRKYRKAISLLRNHLNGGTP